jgi:formate dehydrogenase maturation protein FdhE
MHPTAAYDLAQIGLNNDQIEVYLSMLWKLAKVNGDSYPPKMRRKQEKLFQRQKSAIEDILSEGGVSQVLKFASTVSKADLVGEVMADLDQPMTTQLSEICDVGQLIYTMHPTAAYDLAQIGLNNDQIEVYLSMLWKLAKVNGDSYPPKMRA